MLNRLNKAISQAGFCSRREADRLIEAGKVYVDGQVALVGQQVEDDQDIVIEGEHLTRNQDEVVLAVYKPVGIICTTVSNEYEKDNIIDFIHYPSRVYPVGRLDKNSEGLILLTNNGELMDFILRSRNDHEKEYLVTVNKPILYKHIKAMEQGVPILDTMTKPCTISRISDKTFSIVITQGLNRQIRRMCEYFGYQVTSLKRTRIMNVSLGTMKVGEYRLLNQDEIRQLKEGLE